MKKVKNGAEMRQELLKFKAENEKLFIDTLRKTAFYFHSELMIYTPKDTGFASQHWSIARKKNENIEMTIETLQGLKIGENIYLFNNVPYIKKLNEGWSLQRPKGFLHLAENRAIVFLRSLLVKYNKMRFE